MSTAQLQLPFGRREMTHSKQDNKSQEKSSSTNASAKKMLLHVQELLVPEQDDHMVELTEMFVNDVDLDEWMDEAYVRIAAKNMRMDADRKYSNCFIAYDNKKPIGFLIGVAAPAFHRPGIVAEQKLLYIVPAYRGTRAVLKLLKEFESWARMNGATQLYTGTANLRYAERTSKLFDKLGYARVGALHVKEI